MMRMRKVTSLLLCTAMALFIACGEKQTAEDPNLANASKSVKEGYEHLLAGQYEAFLDTKADADSLPEDYREQILTNYKQFLHSQQKVHGGITSMSISRAAYAEPREGASPADTLDKEIYVFLLLNYADSTQEEVVVPTVRRNSTWKLK